MCSNRLLSLFGHWRVVAAGITLSAAFVLTTPGLHAQDLSVNTFVSRTTIGLNQQFELSVELSGADANSAPQPEVPDLAKFASYVGSGTSTNMQLINGRMSVTKRYTHHFIATREGSFEIPAVTVVFKGKTFSSTPITVTVRSGGTTQPRQSNPSAPDPGQQGDQRLDEILFLKASVDKRQVYQNEAVVVSYKIYTAVNVSNYGISQLPDAVGFWTEDFELPGRPALHNEVVDGRQFKVAEIKKIAAFAQGPGVKTLDPLEIECEVQLPRQRSRRDIFDSFFNDPFFGRTVRRTLRSNPVTIDVMPLPDTGKPSDFSGAVGDYSITASVDKQSVKTNEAIALRVEVAGKGNIRIVPKPKLNFPADFEVYDPKITESVNRTAGVISGRRTLEYVIIPRFAGQQTISPVKFSYFDPKSKAYRESVTDPISITVTKGEDQFASAGLGNSKEDVRFIGQDIRFIQMRLPEFKLRGTVFYKRVWFFLMILLPPLFLAAAVVYRRHQDKISSNVAYARSRKANQMAKTRLKRAGQLMQKGEPQQFYAEISNALTGFVGDKCNVASAGLITDEVNEILARKGVDEKMRSDFLACLHACDFKRFAPSEVNDGEMKSFLAEAKQALIGLDREI